MIGLCLLFLFIAGCDFNSNARKLEKSLIQNYISSLGDTVYISKPSGLYYIELKAGTGRTPVVKDTITFRKVGELVRAAVEKLDEWHKTHPNIYD